MLFDEFGCEVATHGEEVERLDCEDDAPAAEANLSQMNHAPQQNTDVLFHAHIDRLREAARYAGLLSFANVVICKESGVNGCQTDVFFQT